MYSKVNEELHRLSADLLRVTHEKEEALCLCEIAERNAAKQQSLAENVRSCGWCHWVSSFCRTGRYASMID